MKLRDAPQIRKLAYDLGLKPGDDPVTDILNCTHAKIRSYMREFPQTTLAGLLNLVIATLDTEMIEIRTDEELAILRNEMMKKGETAFINIIEELSPEYSFAETIQRQNPRPGDRRFISVIDCRGDKATRRYFSKWHELAHLITLTDQMRLTYCRTHVPGQKKDPEESLMDVIAGNLGYLPELIAPYAKGQISFDAIKQLHQDLCPESSFRAAMIGISNAWPRPCVCVQVGLGYKRAIEDSMNQLRLDSLPTRSLNCAP